MAVQNLEPHALAGVAKTVVSRAALPAALLLAAALPASLHALPPGEMIAEADLAGGLIACIDADLDSLAALRSGETFVVHALYRDAEQVAPARSALRQQGGYGLVSVDRLRGERLPYADNLVNLLIDYEAGSRLPDAEILRGLAPGGLAVLRSRSQTGPHAGWRRLHKPRPESLDEWTHYLHNSTGNPVARDEAVQPPRQLQWVSEPRWARHHEHMASMSALVSSGGRLFSICDEGPKVSMLHPPEWKLTARDAFNGLQLWQRPLDDWLNHLQPLKSGPASLPRRLVADTSNVYVTLGIAAPVSVLDARTGETQRVCRGTAGTQEIVLSEGRLFLVRGDDAGTRITAVDPQSGQVLWDRDQQVVALTLAANREQVVGFDGRQVVALDRDSGQPRWTSAELPERSRADWLAKDPPRLILADQAVVVALKQAVVALGSERGELLWSAPQPRSGYVSPKDLFVIDGLVWYGDTAGARNSGRFEGRDLLTGEVQRSFLPDIDAVWLSHHRCHFSKATCNYILPARMGVEFVDLQRERWTANPWVRGGCIYGIMPCNGLLYAPPHACACYFEAKLNGFTALTGHPGRRSPEPESERLERGPAYRGMAAAGRSSTPDEQWPTFRRDALRSGSTKTAVPAELQEQWRVELGGQLTQPVVAGGRLFVSDRAAHAVHALDAGTGRRLWCFTAGGRVDSPPTIHRGRVLFGCRDGWIYCLDAEDGRLAWRYRAAPRETLIMAYGGLESAWPVSGSVLIENGELHCVAGRNMFLDGGLRYLRLDPLTGRKISQTVMDRDDPLQGGEITKYDSWLDMTTTLPDVLSSDGRNIYMRSLPFDMQGNRRRITHIAEPAESPHLFSPTGFLDDSWFHRSYWTYARTFPGGWVGHLNAGRYNPSGRLLVLDETAVYGFGRQPDYYRWTTSLEYRLFAVDKDAHRTRDIYAYDFFKEAQQVRFPEMKIDRQMGLPSGPRPERLETYACKWEDREVPLLVTAMVATRDALFVAGPEDVSHEGDLFYRSARDGIRGRESELARQAAIWTGQQGGVLLSVSKEDGRRLFELSLDELPVFDGMIAAGGRLFLSTRKGAVVCLGSDAWNG